MLECSQPSLLFALPVAVCTPRAGAIVAALSAARSVAFQSSVGVVVDLCVVSQAVKLVTKNQEKV